MARHTNLLRACAVVALLAALPAVHAQADLPDLATATDATATTATGATSATDATTGETTGGTSATSTGDTTAESTAESTSDATTTGATSITASFPTGVTTNTAGTTGSIFSLTGLPTIAGAGIPTMVVPYTANAPFMQKSALPEGTVFIAVGAVLAFMGACVLLWRGLVAWSINRSVKRSALASIRGSDKGSQWGGAGAGAGAGNKNAYYKEHDIGSSMSLDALTSNGKNIRNSKVAGDDKRFSSAPPAGLFFSPTAQASNRASSAVYDNRGSTYLPAGYYASPNSELAGGRQSAVIGDSLAPYARHSQISPSPPGTPNSKLPNSRSTANYYGGRGFESGLRSSSREGLRASSQHERHSRLYQQPSTSSLAVGGGSQSSHENLPGMRAPSAVFSDMLENHGQGPRERF
ncbi:hypothetical protein CLAFUW4_09935 [Fulvia fulva]|nr:hypothetical protein CLAFUR4_09939 [Fulvia fulva]WPV19544.1 hypothetical protein CLAFUW4_09935 [Fulvia fulva]WPV34017.1 hypothetical protein CLAFUW7_09936 [Fulvia fulva]